MSSPLHFLSLLAASLSWIGIGEIKIAVEFISTGAACFILRFMFVLVLSLKIPSEINIIAIPELIFVDFALHEVFHFGAPLASELHTLDGSFDWRAFL